MKVVQFGLGDFGFGWFEALAKREDIILAGVVDINPNKMQQAYALVNNKPFQFYTDAAAALDEQQPDFIVNATPPGVHAAINALACERNIPILCEKPIAETEEHAQALMVEAQKGQKIVIAQNYRYLSQNRFVKKILKQNPLGDITNVNIIFRRRHHVHPGNYHPHLRHPLLLDVTIHHLDLLRYFLAAEATSVWADFFTPQWSWYQGYSNAILCLTMQTGAKIGYSGSLDAVDRQTSWNGEWEFVGEKGSLQTDGKTLTLHQGGEMTQWPVPTGGEADKQLILDAFIAYLQGGAVPPTHLLDNIKTFNIACAAMRSFVSRQEVALDRL